MASNNIVQIIGRQKDTEANTARTINLDHFIAANDFEMGGVTKLVLTMTGGIEFEFNGLTQEEFNNFIHEVVTGANDHVRTLFPTPEVS